MSIADPTDDDLEVAKALRASVPPWSWDKIACHLAVSQYRLRCELEPGYYVKQLECARRNKEKWRLRRAEQPKLQRGPVVKDITVPAGGVCPKNTGAQVYIPQSVLADRERRLHIEPKDITAALMGDPIPGRSALDQRA